MSKSNCSSAYRKISLDQFNAAIRRLIQDTSARMEPVLDETLLESNDCRILKMHVGRQARSTLERAFLYECIESVNTAYPEAAGKSMTLVLPLEWSSFPVGVIGTFVSGERSVRLSLSHSSIVGQKDRRVVCLTEPDLVRSSQIGMDGSQLLLDGSALGPKSPLCVAAVTDANKKDKISIQKAEADIVLFKYQKANVGLPGVFQCRESLNKGCVAEGWLDVARTFRHDALKYLAWGALAVVGERVTGRLLKELKENRPTLKHTTPTTLWAYLSARSKQWTETLKGRLIEDGQKLQFSRT